MGDNISRIQDAHEVLVASLRGLRFGERAQSPIFVFRMLVTELDGTATPKLLETSLNLLRLARALNCRVDNCGPRARHGRLPSILGPTGVVAATLPCVHVRNDPRAPLTSDGVALPIVPADRFQPLLRRLACAAAPRP
eukprot:tig00000492_g1418.t1